MTAACYINHTVESGYMSHRFVAGRGGAERRGLPSDDDRIRQRGRDMLAHAWHRLNVLTVPVDLCVSCERPLPSTTRTGRDTGGYTLRA